MKREKEIALLLAIVAIFITVGFLVDSFNSSQGAVTVSAIVASSVTCSTYATSTSFSTLTSAAVSTSTPNASSTMSCNTGLGCTLSIIDAGNGVNGGLATSSPAYLIPSPAAGYPSTAELAANTEGYGIQATTTATGSGGTLGINSIYNSYNTATVGKLAITTQTLASSTAITTNREIVVKHKAAISATLTQAGSYVDTITYSCTGN